MNKGKLFVISGPSGVGKGTIVKELIKKRRCALSISCTTRQPRNNEKDGESYFFVSEEKFLRMIEEGGFLEYSRHFENYYGTPRSFVEQKLKEGDVILEIDVDGGLNVRKSYAQAILIFVDPPSIEELKARLRGRGTEEESVIEERLKRAEYELSKKKYYDYVVVNDVLEQAVEKISEIIEKEN